MKTHVFGRLWPVSSLTLGGGGLGSCGGRRASTNASRPYMTRSLPELISSISRRAMATAKLKKL